MNFPFPFLAATLSLALAASAQAPEPPATPAPATPATATAPAAEPAAAPAAASANTVPPFAAVQETRETLHGVELSDPYRYLEDLGSPASQAFFRAQSDHARARLDRIPGREALVKRIRGLSEFQTSITAVDLAGARVFYLKLAPGLVNRVLCVREGFGGAERVLVDPDRFSEGAAKGAIDWFAPSPDGSHVAYGASAGGTEDSVLRVIDVARGRELPVRIDRARLNAQLGWHPDGRSFYYARLPEEADPRRRRASARLYRHELGRDSARDEIVFAPGVGGAREVPEGVHPSIVTSTDSKYAYAIAREGTRREITVHVTELRDLAAAKPRWRRVVGFADEVIAIEPWKDEVMLLTHRGAPRYRILRMSAASPDIARARVLVPEGDAVIQSMAMARDALYLRGTVGGVDRLERVPVGLLGLKKPEFVKTPFDTHISQLVAHPRRPGAVLRLEGWIEPPVVVEVDARSGDLRDTKLQPPPVADFSAMDEVRLYAPSHDGAKIPVTLIYRKTTTLTGENPMLLMAYGAYGTIFTPGFDPTRLAWLERGGILAVAHVRGGGEYGEVWHRGGQKATKRNTVLDFIAAAEFVSRYGFTSARRLAIQGTGAGGIPAGGALVRRPDLFAAVVTRVPMMDMLRFELSADGPGNVPEFGSAATAAGFEALREISAYHQVKDATPYPAVLLTAGMNDARVDPWQAGKMAARLQAATSSARPVLLRVDYAAGHGRGTPRRQREEEAADIYAFLLWQFGHPEFQPPSEERPATAK